MKRVSKALRVISAATALLASAALGACDTSEPSSSDLASACVDVKVDGFKELVVVDEGVLDDARAKNATNGVWSFRHAIEQMTPAGDDPSAFVLAWLRGWVETTSVNGYPVEVPNGEPITRPDFMQEKIICPWLKLTPSNACDDTCGSCKEEKLDLALAPFRLSAITNRIDIRNEVATSPSGEGRLLFFLTALSADPTNARALSRAAPGDDPASKPMPFSVIFEYRHPDTKTTKEWAEAWHALGTFADTGEPYRAALEGVTKAFTERGASPTGVNGSAIAQIRTNETVLNWVWQLREFTLDPVTKQLASSALRNTPPALLNDSPALRDWVSSNREAVLSGKFELPMGLRSGSAHIKQPTRWALTGVDEPLRKAFATSTCNGCHSGEERSLDINLHVSPFQKGVAKLSAHIYDPAGKTDQMRIRTASLQKALCSAP